MCRNIPKEEQNRAMLKYNIKVELWNGYHK